jgi:hypothetical protein
MMTLAEVKALLGVPSGEEGFDVQLTFAIDVVSSMIRDYTSRYLMLDTYIDEFVGPYPANGDLLIGAGTRLNRDGLFLSTWEFPIREVVSFTVDGLDSLPSYRMRRDYGLILPTGYGPGSTIVVEYEAGYATLPANLKSVFLDLVRRQLAALGADISTVSTSNVEPAPMRAVSIGQLRVEYAMGVTMSNVSSTVLSPMSSMVLEEYAHVFALYRHPAQHAAMSA